MFVDSKQSIPTRYHRGYVRAMDIGGGADLPRCIATR